MNLHNVTRRDFLRTSVSGAVILGIAPLFVSGCAGYAKREGAAFKVLDDKAAAIVDAIADAMIDPDASDMPRPSALGVAQRVDAMLAGLHPAVQKETVLLFNVVEHATFPFGGYTRRFTKLDAAEQRAYIASWADSSLDFRRMAFTALKMFIFLNYYSYDETWTALKYDGPWVGRFELPPFELPLAKTGDEESL
jgi:hypothetical protein